MFQILPSGSTVQRDDLHIPTLVVGIAPEDIREHCHVAQVPAFVVVVVGAASADRARAVLGDVYTTRPVRRQWAGRLRATSTQLPLWLL